MLRSFAGELLLLVLSFLAFTPSSASASTNSNASVFVYNQPQTNQQFVFALTIDSPNKDIYIHMSAPAGNSWMGVGIGGHMADALMFIAYASKNGTGVTLSPRVASGHSEPGHYDGVDCQMVYADDLVDGNQVTSRTGSDTMTVNAVCHNATSWDLGGASGHLDLQSPPNSQPFIFAVGPAAGGGPGGKGRHYLQSDSPSADLKRHDFYGHFTMDLSQAVATDSAAASVPRPNGGSGDSSYTTSGASQATNAKGDHDPATTIHGFVMCFTFVLVFPFGSLVLRVLHRVKGHAIVQAIGLVLVCMASAGGFVVSTKYNRSRDVRSAHQVLGILVLIAMFLQLGLGILHHRIFQREQRPTILGKVHLYLGPVVMVVGIVNGFLGFVLALNPFLCLPYTVILVLVAIAFVSMRFFARRCWSRRFQKQQPPPPVEGYQHPQFGPAAGADNGTSAGAGHPFGAQYMPPPPAYSRQGSYRSDDVPLRPYNSQSSGVHSSQLPTDPRPMV